MSAQAHEWPQGDVCPALSRSNGTTVITFQRIAHGEHLGYYRAIATPNGLTNIVQTSRPDHVWPPSSGQEALPGHWQWYAGFWHTIDPRSGSPATLCILQSNHVKTVALSARQTMFEPSIESFVITNDLLLTIGYTRPPDDDDPFSTAPPQSASLCIFSVQTGELRKEAVLGPYEYAGMLTTLTRSRYIVDRDHCRFLWIKRNPRDSSLSLVLTTVALNTLHVTHRTVRDHVSGNTPLSVLQSDGLLLVGFHNQSAPDAPAQIEILKLE